MTDSVAHIEPGPSRDLPVATIGGTQVRSCGDLLLTGASGFLGSHLAVRWLRGHPGAAVGCLVRAHDGDGAGLRMRASLVRAASDGADPHDVSDMLPRAIAFAGELGDDAWVDEATSWRSCLARRPFRVVHCAANLSFRPADRDAVMQANVEGTRRMLDAAERLGACEFNYVSTAYVAGDQDGDIAEAVSPEAPGFSNAYEESKWEAEALVRSRCAASGMPFRILRPSIIIAHSVTHRLSALSGFYKVIETMSALARLPGAREQGLVLPVPDGSTLDLVPVDVVVGEMIALLDAGPATLGKVFHLTSDSPLSLREVLETMSPIIGVPVRQAADGAAPAPTGKLSHFAMQRLRHYAPYLAQVRRFDRGNVRSAGIPAQETIDMRRLAPYVTSFLAGTK